MPKTTKKRALTPGEYLRQARIHADYTQARLAAELKIRKQAVSAFECGRAPIPPERIQTLSQVLAPHLQVKELARLIALDIYRAILREQKQTTKPTKEKSKCPRKKNS